MATQAEVEALARKLRNAASKRWRDTHKEHIKEYQKRYWERKALEALNAKEDL